MYRILYKENLNKFVTRMDVFAPLIAKKAEAGQFVILRVNETGERIPLTIAKTDNDKGTVTIIFQVAGGTTQLLDKLEVGESILDFVGPLGKPSEIEKYKNAIVVGGGVGSAIAFPEAKALYESGAKVKVIAGFRNKELVILEDDFKAVSDKLYLMTDDGSYGEKGFVTEKLKELLEESVDYDLVIAIGPMPMMKAVADTTKSYGIKSLVSMNPIMIDGTGMCGGCRLTVGGKVKFACIDGPEFDAHQIDWDEAISRAGFYKREEKNCRLLKTD